MTWQAILDDQNRVVTVNNWEHAVGVPCEQDTPTGYVWTGAAFVEHPDDTERRYDAELMAFFDRKAMERRYENRVTCALRAGFPGPFQADGLAFAQWMDQCNAYGYQVIDDVKAGKRQLPSEDEFIAELPPMVWPNT